MIILISGASHTGKTLLAQKLLEKYRYPYLSQDHLKMGLIRSKNTELTVYDDEALTPYLWNITREIIKTAVENKQNLIIEGCYIPFDWQKDFSKDYLINIKYICLIMTEKYIENNFDKIKEKASVIESRIDGGNFSKKDLIKDNLKNLNEVKNHSLPYVLIDENYIVDADDIL